MRTFKWRVCGLAVCASVGLVMAACGSSTAGGSAMSGGSTAADVPASTPVPFNTFMQQVTNARYSDYAGRPTTKVQNEQAFEEMRAYLLKRYQGVQVSSSYVEGGQTFDCVVSSTPGNQPTPPAPSTLGHTPPMAGYSGVSSSSQCKNGTIPTQRITLDVLVQFPALHNFFAKSPGGEGVPPIPSPSPSNT